MRQSNTYVLIFTAVMTIVIGGTLSVANQVLRPAQLKSIELDTKTQILNAVMELQKGDDILGMYRNKIQGIVVDFSGNEIATDSKGNSIQADKVNVVRNFKKNPEEREYPVYKLIEPSNPGVVASYIFPVYGNGLWNGIFGYVALESDLNTIRGVSFGHIGETPGLGARISDKEIEKRYIGKTIFDENGNMVSVVMRKGEKKDPTLFGSHEVDGMSGATLTAKGLNAMLQNYLNSYENYIKKVQSQDAI